jgi:uncharacterized protein YbaR (Trm112 family)
MISPDLLRILVCPETHAPLVLTKEGHLLSTNRESRRLYRVEDGIPNLLIDESQVLGEEEYDRMMAEAKQAAGHAK